MLFMKLTMYNMAFGESFLLSEEEENLVIDLGSDLSSFNYAPIFADITAKGKGKSTSLLLTHFHRDHIGGVLDSVFVPNMPPLHKIYLPNLLGVPILGQFDLLKSSILSEVLKGILIDRRRKRLTLHALLLQIRSAHTQAFFLEQGHSFSVGNKQYHVLWPCIRAANEINKRTLKRVNSWFEHFGQVNPDLNLLQVLEQYELALVAEYGRLNEEAGDRIYPQLDTLEDNVWLAVETLTSHMDNHEKSSTNSLADTLKDLGNRLSIVFQDAQASSNGTLPILMTGDVPKDILEDILQKPTCHSKYAVIKAPHHGTETHFSRKLPTCDKIAISNGHTSLSKRGVISYQYNTVYGSNSNPHPAQLICSNRRCGLLTFSPSRHCPSHCVCGIGPSSYTII